MKSVLPTLALDQLFKTARTFGEFTEAPVEESLIQQIYELLKWGPTSANCCPARFVWVRSREGKEKLAGLAMDMNRNKILAAPITVIIGNDLNFPDSFPKLLPAPRAAMMQQMFQQPDLAKETAMRNGSLQGAYLIMAARALGLDCGPMSGFNNAGVDQAFFAGTKIQSNFICCLGFGKEGSPHPRNPRLEFEEAGSFA
jgi:3-hydroxypropanoate dehydrogenase